MSAEPTTEQKLPMYASYATFVTFLDWIGQMQAMPSQIDRSLWEGKFSGSSGAQLISGLRFLGLLNDDRPTQELEALAKADKEARRVLFKEMLARAYGPAIISELPRMTPRMLDDALRALGSTDATHRKAVSFFVNTAKNTDIALPMAIQKKARVRTVATRRNGTAAGRRTSYKQGEESPPPTPRPPSNSLDALRIRYVEMLLKQAEASPDAELLDRIESLLGFEYQPS